MNEPLESGEVPFEELLQKLEAIVRKLEDGQLGLGEALAHYEQGIGYLKRCQSGLDGAERRIELLTGLDREGNPLVVPFDDEQLETEKKTEVRSRRRSKPTASPSSDNKGDRDDDEPGRLF